MSKLKPCPFCGKSETVEYTDSRELEFCYPGCDKKTCVSAAVVCNYNIGGCGATSGFAPTLEDALRLWNARVERTCKYEPIINPYGEITEYMCECGHCCGYVPSYCPSCGAKVVWNYE